MNKFIIALFAVFSFSVSANDVEKLFKNVNESVVELHVKSLNSPKPGQVNYKVSVSNGLGSGSLINKEGDILTAAHVVAKATEIEVLFSDGSKTSGHILWIDPIIDIAMIRARKTPDHIKPLPLAKAKNYSIGEQVVAIGAPFGISNSLSVGYLSGIRVKKTIPGTNIAPKLIQTDAAINKGNSGGPLFNLDGEIIGVVSHILSRSGGSNGLGFAVSVDTVKEVIDSEPLPFLGITPFILNKKHSDVLNNPYGYGILTQFVVKGTPAHKLGLKGGYMNIDIGRDSILLGGDIIIAVEDIPLKSISSLNEIKDLVQSYKSGDNIVIIYIRNGEEKRTVWTKE